MYQTREQAEKAIALKFDPKNHDIVQVFPIKRFTGYIIYPKGDGNDKPIDWIGLMEDKSGGFILLDNEECKQSIRCHLASLSNLVLALDKESQESGRDLLEDFDLSL